MVLPHSAPQNLMLRLCGEGLGMKRSDVQARSAELLSMVGLAGEKSRIKGFSRGMKQRLVIFIISNFTMPNSKNRF